MCGYISFPALISNLPIDLYLNVQVCYLFLDGNKIFWLFLESFLCFNTSNFNAFLVFSDYSSKQKKNPKILLKYENADTPIL